MQCPHCGFANPAEGKFCGECGTLLKNRCPQCGYENPSPFKFCGECGTPLPEPTQASPTPSTPTLPPQAQKPGDTLRSAGYKVPEAERRQLTVMFCDLVGSTELSIQLDPEEFREVLQTYHRACAQVISRFGGYLAKYMGDGLLVYFGYPLAHEDAVQRAVRAGLGIIEGIKNLNTSLQQERGVTLSVRLSIHTGLVVAGEMGAGETREPLAIVGETPNLAARLQSLAEPNTLVISAATYRLIQGFFDCQTLGFHLLKGITQPIEVYRVLRESQVQSRLEVAVATGLTPLIGRKQEVEVLMERWEWVKSGHGQIVLIRGEAGIGKSRLVQVLKDRITHEPYRLLECRCSPFYQHSALYPVMDLLQRLFQFTRDHSPAEKLQKLEENLTQDLLSFPNTVPLLASLLSVPLPAHYPPLHLTPQRQKQKTLEALLTLVLAMTTQRPVLFVIEDLHWIDPSTLDLLTLLIEQAPKARLLILLTFRPLFRPPWESRAALTQLVLDRLDHQQVELMIQQITRGKALPTNVLHQLVTKTDGVPLFVEELTKMVLESDLLQEQDDHYILTGLFPSLAIPATLHDSLMARLDRLSTVKAVAQLGATLGREFSYELLQAVSSLDEETLQRELARLVEAELLYQQGEPPQAVYTFKHALIQEAAYQSLLRSTRQQYHRQIAQVLAEQFPETVETQPELLAYHFTAAGLNKQAIQYWYQAGKRALQRSAHTEAISHVTKGLDLLKASPSAPEHIQQELLLQTALGQAHMATKGYAAPEVELAYARARELCHQMGDIPQLFSVLVGLRAFYDVRAELKTGRELGEQLLRLAHSTQEPALLLEAHRGLGVNLFYGGELVAAQNHLTQGSSLYDAKQHRSLAFVYGQDPEMVFLTYQAMVLCLQGYPEQALQKSREALSFARELAHPFTLGYALDFAAVLHHFCRDPVTTQQFAEEAIELATEQGFRLWLTLGTILRGWALVAQGKHAEGITHLEQGLTAVRATGAELGKPHFLTLLAEAYGLIGQPAKGLEVIDEAVDTIHKNGERYYEAEVYRIKGELWLAQKANRRKEERGKKAETFFYQALEAARHQQARLLELRAAMSLSRLWQQQGKPSEAYHLLSEVYGWFTEGFARADLQEAKILLDTLAQTHTL